MRSSTSKKPKITAQMLFAFGLFLLVLVVLYVFFWGKPQSPIYDKSGFEDSLSTNEVESNDSVTQSSHAERNTDKNTSSKLPVIKLDNSASKVNQVVADSVSIYTESSVDGLRLPNRNLMQSNAIYREGLDAYLLGDFDLAYKRWARAAQRDHAKAYFNLGLLAGKVSSEQIKGLKSAEYYFNKANDLGYSPANIVLDQSKDSAAKESSATQFIENTGSLSDIGKETWVARQGDQQWTIQVRAFREKQELNNFLDTYEFGANVAYFREPSSQGVLYKLVIGAFDSRDAASDARATLPKEVRDEGPWLRRFGDIKKTMIGS